MKLNPHFKLRSIAGEIIIVNQGVPDTDLTRIISFNFSACLLWKRLSGKDFTLQEAALVLVESYHIPQPRTAAAVHQTAGCGCCAKSGAEASAGKQTGCGYRAVR